VAAFGDLEACSSCKLGIGPDKIQPWVASEEEGFHDNMPAEAVAVAAERVLPFPFVDYLAIEEVVDEHVIHYLTDVDAAAAAAVEAAVACFHCLFFDPDFLQTASTGHR
jgi:hypothetical protein